ncbi:monocyte to macrophage differentiation factor 2 [Copidosoma floridanum]|uniref:monocyte to macrophage differentiation factor 2 n=1 Tax=Copidosoma floridanum TaxID=29053 RepID=UPI0006C9677C|nr:monocyte to macrophage differentiation factor 2 [Copidosoma floridanum]XP_014213745.1 monocyte to macrophage differentiation factor 2 [Copidosoma floridanum]XP_014213746.1 monocyte to macrophage differentiation factor 2 [Copidosoma floridanum]XP_014213747.1 monocyte to macrophage differentiation factor 2 [Copidosoma floridanum]XP_014213748.1 monocyte to macrophage differentiation factor 2 [Copidosoma floridanum]
MRRLKEVKWMNPKACTNQAYVPTFVEHVANVVSHGIWIVPAFLGALELIERASTWPKLLSALIYGTSLSLLFIVSTVFHGIHYCFHKGKLTSLKDVLHRCDRAMIYVFIAASYFPWLNHEPFQVDVLLPTTRILIWIMAAVGILYQQIFHERYKWLETLFYVIMGLGPSVAIVGISMLSNASGAARIITEYDNIAELKLGGLAYLVGIVFFKADGRIPCAHAIWHLFVAVGAGFHYLAILRHLYPDSEVPILSSGERLLGFFATRTEF